MDRDDRWWLLVGVVTTIEKLSNKRRLLGIVAHKLWSDGYYIRVNPFDLRDGCVVAPDCIAVDLMLVLVQNGETPPFVVEPRLVPMSTLVSEASRRVPTDDAPDVLRQLSARRIDQLRTLCAIFAGGTSAIPRKCGQAGGVPVGAVTTLEEPTRDRADLLYYRFRALAVHSLRTATTK